MSWNGLEEYKLTEATSKVRVRLISMYFKDHTDCFKTTGLDYSGPLVDVKAER